MFALTRATDGPFDVVIGYGLVLPDGSAVAVSWPKCPGASTYSTASAQECAELRGASLKWIGDEQ